MRLDLVIAPIQSQHLIPRLYVFGVMFVAWLGALIVVLSAPQTRHNTWACALVVAVFTVTYSGIWVVPAQAQFREGLQYAAQIEHLRQTGHIFLGITNFLYFHWPGSFIFTSVFGLVTGLSTVHSQLIVVLVIVNALFSVLLFLVYAQILPTRALAGLGVLLTVMGNTMLTKLLQQYHPGTFGLTIFALLLFLLALGFGGARRSEGEASRLMLLALVLAALTVSHMVSSLAAFLVLVGVAATATADRRPLSAVAILAAVVPVAWLTSFAVTTGDGLIRSVFGAVRLLLSGDPIAALPMRLATIYLGGASPWWASAVHLGWMSVVLGGGGVAVARDLLRLRRLGADDRAIVGGTVGIAALGALAFGASQGTEAIRFLTYAPLFTVPALLRMASDVGSHRRVALVLPVFLILLSLPSFLANNNTTGFDIKNYPAEATAGAFLRSTLGSGEGVRVFGTEFYDFVYYLPFATLNHVAYPLIGMKDPALVRQGIDAQIDQFADEAGGEPSVWVHSRRALLNVYFLSGVRLPETRLGYGGSLGGRADLTYMNGDVWIFFPCGSVCRQRVEGG